jgi:copper chaperone
MGGPVRRHPGMIRAKEQAGDEVVKQIKVVGMTCGHCVKAVTKALEALPEAKHVSVDLAGGTAAVDTSADDAAIRAAIEDAGYDVASIT